MPIMILRLTRRTLDLSHHDVQLLSALCAQLKCTHAEALHLAIALLATVHLAQQLPDKAPIQPSTHIGASPWIKRIIASGYTSASVNKTANASGRSADGSSARPAKPSASASNMR